MSQDYETKRSDLRASRDEPGVGGTAGEDPLVELARIVHKNKQSGANVNSGRVGSTDYFAGLEDFAGETAAPDSITSRQEPSFSPGQGHDAVESPTLQEQATEQEGAGSETDPSSSRLNDLAGAFAPPQTPSTSRSSHVSSLWPDLQTPDPSAPQGIQPVPFDEPAGPEAATTAEGHRHAPEQFEQVAANDPTSLAPSLSVNLEQNLTAELEDELIGALRQSVDETQPKAGSDDGAANLVAPESADSFQPVSARHDTAREPFRAETDIPVPRGDRTSIQPPAFETAPQTPYPAPADPSFAREERNAPTPTVEPSAPLSRAQPPADAPAVAAVEPAAVQRPRIDENDFFAALNPAQDETSPAQPFPASDQGGDPAGIDALFADLDFPPPGDRKTTVQDVQEPAAEKDAGASDIDDMTWPAAAAAVPQPTEDETPPPPEGYDLDAVARAMQESDPSLTGAGVLPPHSSAEKEAVPHSREKSRRGLFVAAGVLGIAVLGAAGFFLTDGDGVVVPSGPPPVISGLQEPLKIYPEESQPADASQAAKLDYSRIDGSGVAGPDTLVLPESPQPADLPPAPAGTSGNADLVPGAPKRVRTVIVRPDGTFVSDDDPASAAANTPSASVPAPSSAAPETPSEDGASRVAVTTPIAPDAEPPQQELPAETAPTSPAASETPAIVTGTEQPAAAPEAAEPALPVPTVLPRKKPAAPVRVANAPPATTPAAPAPQNDGPLNLTQQPAAAAPAPASTGTTGTIAPGTYIVQVTSQRSAAAATDAYSGLQRRFPAILGNQNAVIVSANVEDRGVFYRARIPTSSRDDAISLCERLQAAGGDCFVRRQP